MSAEAREWKVGDIVFGMPSSRIMPSGNSGRNELGREPVWVVYVGRSPKADRTYLIDGVPIGTMQIPAIQEELDIITAALEAVGNNRYLRVNWDMSQQLGIAESVRVRTANTLLNAS